MGGDPIGLASEAALQVCAIGPRGRCHGPRRFHSCLFVSIRGANSTQERIQVIVSLAFDGRNDFQWVFLKVWLSRLISEC
jgi:hypothetical protein